MAGTATAICGLLRSLVATFFLVRHATCDPVGNSIAGRAPGIHLNDEGRRQAEALVERFGGIHVDSIYTSPLERARETIQPLARARGLEPAVVPEILELDFGRWTGARLDELASDPQWKLFNADRAATRIPGGETMREAQDRAIQFLRSVAGSAPQSRNIIVSHGDIIRAMIMNLLDIPLNSIHRLEIAPASISVVEILSDWAVVRSMNVRESLAS